MESLFYLNDIENVLDIGLNGSENNYEPENAPLGDWIENWDFKNVSTDLYTHKIHRYPAMFIPQLTRKLIQKFSKQGDTILDIFCGSGTLLVESKLLNRNAIGIELNPLALLISKVKTTPIIKENVPAHYNSLLTNYFDDQLKYKLVIFNNIDFWFGKSAIKSISKLIHCINKIDDRDLSDLMKISLSEIIREVSSCRHSGFKLHKDKEKEKTIWTDELLFEQFHIVFIKNLKGVLEFQIAVESNSASTTLISGDSKKPQQIKNESIDLIITSPPYGDSRTTVAYGQFSRLSSQWLGLGNDLDFDISGLDNELLGGKTKGIEIDDDVMKKSKTLSLVLEVFNSRLQKLEKEKDDYKKLYERYKDVVSFYRDLDITLKNGANYLKKEKYFILVTGSREVKSIKLHTDIIISELAENYGFVLKSIFYRNIINKRMPNKVSSTNIVGEVSPTMTKESIVVLKKQI